MADDWESNTEPISQPSQPAQTKPRILARPQQAPAATSTDQNPRYDSAFPALGAGVDVGGQREDEGDDDWFRGPQQNNRQLWDTANLSTPSVIAPAASGPPPRMQILKRPSDAPKSRSATPQNRPQKSLTQREEEYRLARERIFGESGASGSGTSSPTGSQTASQPTQPALTSQSTPAAPIAGLQQGQGQGQRDTTSAPPLSGGPQGGQLAGQQGGPYRDGSRGDYSRDQSRESSVSGRRRGNATPRSGRASPDDLSRDLASLSMGGRGGRTGPGGPAPVLRGGMSPGVLRQPRGPSGAGFNQGQQQQAAEEEKRKDFARSNSGHGVRRDDSFNRGPSEYTRNAGPNEYSRTTNEYARNTPNEYTRTTPNEYNRNLGEFSRSTPGAVGAAPEFSRSSSYSSTASQGSYGFPTGPGYDAGRGYIGAVGAIGGAGVPNVGNVGAIGSPYGSPSPQGYPYQQYTGFQQHQQQPGYPQHVSQQQQTGYYARPPYSGQQLYGYPSAPAAGKNTYPYTGPGGGLGGGIGGGSYGVPGGPPGPPSQQPGRPQGGQHGQQQQQQYYRGAGAAGYGQ